MTFRGNHFKAFSLLLQDIQVTCEYDAGTDQGENPCNDRCNLPHYQ